MSRLLTLLRRKGEDEALTLPADNLVGVWRFDEGSGQVLTGSSGGSDGQLGSASGADANDPTWEATGLLFDGTDDYVIVPHFAAANLAAPFTLTLVLRDTATANRVVFEKNGNAGFSLQTGEPPTFTGRLQLLSASSLRMRTNLAYNDGAWHCHQLRHAAGANSWRVDGAGVALSTDATTGTPAYGTNTPVYVGGRAATVAYPGRVAYVIMRSGAASDTVMTDEYAFLKAALAPRGISLP